jgi:pilus assembly protein Flp/PilA
MSRLMQSVRRLLRSDEGPTAVEYAVMLSLIIVVCLAAVRAIGTNAKATFQNTANSIAS